MRITHVCSSPQPPHSFWVLPTYVWVSGRSEEGKLAEKVSFFLEGMYLSLLLGCCCVFLFFLETWEGSAVIACVFGRSLERVEGRRTAREMSGIVTLSLFFVCLVGNYQTVF